MGIMLQNDNLCQAMTLHKLEANGVQELANK
jgi:hypothetical protein